MNQERNLNKKVRILIVEDETIIAKCLKMDLESSGNGYEVVDTITTGEGAIEYVKKEYYNNNRLDLILTDIGLAGEMSGIQATKEILENYKDIKVIYCSANINEETKPLIQKSGAKGALIKPVNKNDLVTAIKQVLAGKETYHFD